LRAFIFYFFFLLKITTIRNISYIDFYNNLWPFRVFSLADVRKAFPRFDSRRLVEWQKKGYIIKLINKHYAFKDINMSESMAFRISNTLYPPSYVSLESALSYYQIIPEGVFTLQAVSTRKTITYTTPLGSFHYRSIKARLYFGYTITQSEGLPVLLAEPEKALLDHLYLNPQIKMKADIEAFRFNMDALSNAVNWEKLSLYARIFNSQVLNRRITYVKDILTDAHAF
jgi:predicted transcriptional regulator of viral defense system